MADLLSYLPAVNPTVMYPLLKFIYSVILYMEHSPQGTQVRFNLLHVLVIIVFATVILRACSRSMHAHLNRLLLGNQFRFLILQKSVFVSTLRRIGEELYKPEVITWLTLSRSACRL